MNTEPTVGPEQTKDVVAALLKLKGSGGTWSSVAADLGVNQGHISRAVNRGYCSPLLYATVVERKLVKPTLTKEYAVCDCGEFHPMIPCPKKRKKRERRPRRSFQVPLGDIDKVIEKIEKEYGIRLEVVDAT